MPLYQIDTLTATAATPYIRVGSIGGTLTADIFQHSPTFSTPIFSYIQSTAVFRAFFFQGVIICLTAVSCIVERLRAVTEHYNKPVAYIQEKAYH